MSVFKILVHWDAEARVWWAASEDVPGLVAESTSMEGMVEELRAIVPELLSLNMDFNGPFQIDIAADRVEGVAA